MNKTNLTHQKSVTLTFTRVISLYEVNLGSIGVTHCFVASFVLVWLCMSCHFFFTSFNVLKQEELEFTLGE